MALGAPVTATFPLVSMLARLWKQELRAPYPPPTAIICWVCLPIISQETAQTHHAALVTLKKQTVRLREDKERAERALQEMRVRHNETEAGAQVWGREMTKKQRSRRTSDIDDSSLV